MKRILAILASDPARAEVLGRMQALARKFHAKYTPSPH